MSWITRSGKHFLDVDYRNHYKEKCTTFNSQIAHLQGCPDFKWLPKPTLESYIKNDVINSTHPAVYERNLMNAHLKSMAEKHDELRSKFIGEKIDEVEWSVFKLNHKIDMLTYTWLFGNNVEGIYPFNKKVTSELENLKNIKKELVNESKRCEATETD